MSDVSSAKDVAGEKRIRPFSLSLSVPLTEERKKAARRTKKESPSFSALHCSAAILGGGGVNKINEWDLTSERERKN